MTDPTITSQIRKLAGSGADTFLNITTPKFSALAIATIAKSDWKPLHILNNVGASKTLVLTPVGLENAKGIVSATYFKDPDSPDWADDEAMKEYKDNMKKFAPRADPNESFCAYGWAAAATMVEALKNMKEPTRDSLMESIRSIDTEIPLLLPGDQREDGRGVRRLPDRGHADHGVRRGELAAAGRRDRGVGPELTRRSAALPTGGAARQRAQPAPARAVAAAERVGVAALGRLEVDHPDARVGVVGRSRRGLAGAEHGEPLGEEVAFRYPRYRAARASAMASLTQASRTRSASSGNAPGTPGAASLTPRPMRARCIVPSTCV